jgi:hypothetical protein
MWKWLKASSSFYSNFESGFYWGLGCFAAVFICVTVVFVVYSTANSTAYFHDRIVLGPGSNDVSTPVQRDALKVLLKNRLVMTNEQAIEILLSHFNDLIVLVVAMLGFSTFIGYITVSRRMEKEINETVVRGVETYISKNTDFADKVGDLVDEDTREPLSRIGEKIETIELELNLRDSVRLGKGIRSKKVNNGRN